MGPFNGYIQNRIESKNGSSGNVYLSIQRSKITFNEGFERLLVIHYAVKVSLLGKLNAIEEIQNIFCTCMTNHRQCAILKSIYIFFKLKLFYMYMYIIHLVHVM